MINIFNSTVSFDITNVTIIIGCTCLLVLLYKEMCMSFTIYAFKKNLRFESYFFLSLLVTPVIAFIILLIHKRVLKNIKKSKLKNLK